MASIAGIGCVFVKCVFPVWKVRSVKWTVPGIHGYGFALLGSGDAVFGITAVGYDDDDGIETWAAQLYAKQGSIQTIINDQGNTAQKCFLERVGTVEKMPAVIPGTDTTTRGVIRIKATRL